MSITCTVSVCSTRSLSASLPTKVFVQKDLSVICGFRNLPKPVISMYYTLNAMALSVKLFMDTFFRSIVFFLLCLYFKRMHFVCASFMAIQTLSINRTCLFRDCPKTPVEKL